jgi:hypothetical protein
LQELFLSESCSQSLLSFKIQGFILHGLPELLTQFQWVQDGYDRFIFMFGYGETGHFLCHFPGGGCAISEIINVCLVDSFLKTDGLGYALFHF